MIPNEFQNLDFNYEVFFNLHLDLLCITDNCGNFLHTNKAFEDNLSYTNNDLYMQSLFDFIHPHDLPDLYKNLNTIDKNNGTLKFVNRIRHKNGTYRYMEWYAKSFEQYIYASARDINTFQKKENILRENTLQIQTILESQTNYLIRLNLDYQYTYVNNIFEREFGFLYKNKALIGTNAFDGIAHFDNFKKLCHDLKSIINTNLQIEVEIPRENQDSLFILWDCICLSNSEGEAYEIQCIGINISDRKNKQKSNELKSEAEFLELSSPISELWNGILFLPIIGHINEKRAIHLNKSILNKIADTKAKIIIIDISGLGLVDNKIVHYITNLTKATNLMGCLCTLCGISPKMAKGIVEAGLKLSHVSTTINIKKALENILKLRNHEIVKIQ